MLTSKMVVPNGQSLIDHDVLKPGKPFENVVINLKYFCLLGFVYLVFS